MSSVLRIGEVARATGFTADAIRFYERERLLKRPGRTEGGFRLFTAEDIRALRFIRKAQELGFSLSDIRELLWIEDGRTQACSHVRDRLQQKLENVRAKIGELKKLERKLQAALRKCNRELAGGAECAGRRCPVLEEMRQAAGE